MLLSLSLIFIIGFSLSGIFAKCKIPGILAMILTGILLGPYVMDAISPDILNISSELRTIALVIILTRVGLSLDIYDLKRIGRPAFLLALIPSTLEIASVTFLAPILLPVSHYEAAVLGAVLAAVSPATVVPRMIQLAETGYGTKRYIPQLIMAGASVDNIYVIMIFTFLMSLQTKDHFSPIRLLSIPVSAIMGILLGVISGFILVYLFKRFHFRDTIKVLLILSVAFLFVVLEKACQNTFPISGLLAVIALGCTILKKYEELARRLTTKFAKIWVVTEPILFVLVGAIVDITSIPSIGLSAIALIILALLFRVTGVWISLIRSKLTIRERLFCAISYLPKATVQASIGAIPLASGMAAGNTILTLAFLAILITAPLGSILMDATYPHLLTKETDAA